MIVPFVKHEQFDRSIAISLNNNASFFEHRSHLEISSVDLVHEITIVPAGTDANQINDTAPVISQIQIIPLLHLILSMRE